MIFPLKCDNLKELDDLSVHLYLTYHHCWARKVSPDPSKLPSSSNLGLGDGTTSQAEITDNEALAAASEASSRSMLSPGPNAIPVVWTGPSPYQSSSLPVRFDAESVYSGSLGSASMSISDENMNT